MEINQYLSFYQNILHQEFKWKDYTNYHQNLSDFINNFPIKDTDFDLDLNIDTILHYIKEFPFLDEKLRRLVQTIEKKTILYFISQIQKHKEKIITVLQLDNTITTYQKKRLYLGIVWFGIGFGICYLISKMKNIDNFPTLHQASQNSYLIFLTCCFIYYDDILDSNTIPENTKKICLEYTSYFFEYLKTKRLLEINDIVNKFIKNSQHISEEHLEIITKTNRILSLLFDLQYQEPNSEILQAIHNLFLVELKTSKIQKMCKERDIILECSIEKSYKSVLAIFCSLCPKVELSPEIHDLIYKFSFLSQLLDDLNDIEIDKVENNNTIFTIGTNIQLDIDRCMNYIYYIYSLVSKYKIDSSYLLTTHYFNILVFNYAIGKNSLLSNKYQKYIPILSSDILSIRNNKNNYLKKMRI